MIFLIFTKKNVIQTPLNVIRFLYTVKTSAPAKKLLIRFCFCLLLSSPHIFVRITSQNQLHFISRLIWYLSAPSCPMPLEFSEIPPATFCTLINRQKFAFTNCATRGCVDGYLIILGLRAIYPLTPSCSLMMSDCMQYSAIPSGIIETTWIRLKR